MNGVLVRRGNLDTDICTHSRETTWGHREKVAIYKLKKEASEETKPAAL